jgi:hypothetical protein
MRFGMGERRFIRKPAWAENLFQIGTDDGFEEQFGRNSTRYEEDFAAQNTFV